MLRFLIVLARSLWSSFQTRHELAIENLALRQQLAVFKHHVGRPRLTDTDRAFWVVLTRLWGRWRDAVVIVKPETVVRWHRRGFRYWWAWKSRRRGGRPRIPREVRQLIRTMSRSNPTWGAPRIHGELRKLGIEVSQATVAKYMIRQRKPPSVTWRTFLDNHVRDLVSVDFFAVPTATFRVLFVFVLLAHDRRQVVHFNVTEQEAARWTALQVLQAFPDGEAPRYLLRDRDGIYGHDFTRTVDAMGIEHVITALCSPWQNPYCERLIGSIRRECLDHVVVLGEKHLRRILTRYFDYYAGSRTHLSLGKDCPEPREVQPPEMGHVVELPMVGGLHHRYERRAA